MGEWGEWLVSAVLAQCAPSVPLRACAATLLEGPQALGFLCQPNLLRNSGLKDKEQEVRTQAEGVNSAGDAWHERPAHYRKGSTILSPLIFWSCCRSSVYRVLQPASRAAVMISES